MLKSYLTITLRRLWREKGYAAINLTGLSVALACALLVALFLRDELSHDRLYEHADRIVFVGAEDRSRGEASPRRGRATPYPLATSLQQGVPSVERATRTLWPGPGEVSRDGETFAEVDGVFHADSAFFEVFTFPFVQGDPATALDEPNTAVISQDLADRYFAGENPIGQTLHVRERGEHAYRVTSVARSSEKSHFDFNAVLSMSTLDYGERYAQGWGMSMFQTFALRQEAAPQAAVDTALARLGADISSERSQRSFFSIPITQLYLSEVVTAETFRGQWRYVYVFGAAALFILLLAGVNYVNLATARAVGRSREVGMRKTLGAGRYQVARQFLGEAVLLSAAAFVVALLLAHLALPAFSQLVDLELALSYRTDLPFLFLLAGGALAVGLFAGTYPALYLSGFRPVAALRDRGPGGAGGAYVRKALVTVQFAVTIVLLAATAIVYEQMQYVQTRDLGFDEEQVVMVPLPGRRAWQDRAALREDVASHPSVASATVANAAPGRAMVRLGVLPEEVASDHQAPPDQQITFFPAVVDTAFVETLGLRLLAGRGFAGPPPADDREAYVLNRTAVRALGWSPEEAVGKAFQLGGGPGTVVGVVEDFHVRSLHHAFAPVALQVHDAGSWSASGMLLARLRPEATREALRHVERRLTRYAPEVPFSYEFLDDVFDAMYRKEQRFGQVVGLFTGIAILIACLGLFGLAAYAAERRTKEIGIRKVLGASVASLAALLSKDFVRLVLLAFVVAAPVAYLLMQRWLEDFAYRIEISGWTFLVVGIASCLIALMTVSYQAIKAALADPIKSLRYE